MGQVSEGKLDGNWESVVVKFHKFHAKNRGCIGSPKIYIDMA